MQPPFPTLSRKPALKTRGTTLDPTLRDTYENGMESSRARFTRHRRQWDVSIDALTEKDHDDLERFVEKIAVYGANSFALKDYRFRDNRVYIVRFSTVPSYSDAGSIEGEFRQNCTFSVREV